MGATAAIAEFISHTSTPDFPSTSAEKAHKALAKEIAVRYERIDAAENPACRGDDPLFETRSSGSKGFVEVKLRLRDGRSEKIRVDKAPGSPAREFAWDELREKITDCARHSQHIEANRARQAFDVIWKLATVKDITGVTRLLC